MALDIERLMQEYYWFVREQINMFKLEPGVKIWYQIYPLPTPALRVFEG